MFTLVQHSGFARNYDNQFVLMCEAVPVENDKRRGLIPLFDGIRLKGGLLLADEETAQKHARRENFPEAMQGIGRGVRGSFAHNLVIQLDGWSSPLYIPGWSDLRIREAILQSLLLADEWGMTKSLVWHELRKLGIRLRAFERVLNGLLFFGHVEKMEGSRYRLGGASCPSR
jgi:hypothetical protein